MNHRSMYRHLCENLDEDLDSAKCREIKKHLQGCPDCQAYLDSLKKTVALYRMSPTPGVSQALHRKLVKVIALEMPRVKRGPSSRSRTPSAR